MKSDGNGVVLKGNLQVLHIHVFLAAPLGAGHMAQPGADRHESGIAVRETAYHTGTAPDLPVEAFNDVVRADPRPVLRWEVAIGQSFLNAVLHLPGSFLQLHGTQFFHHSLGFLPSSFLTLLSADCFEHLGHQLYLRTRCNGENIPVKVDCTPLVLASGNTSPTASGIPRHLPPTTNLTPPRPRPRGHWKKLNQLALSSFMPSAAPEAFR